MATGPTLSIVVGILLPALTSLQDAPVLRGRVVLGSDSAAAAGQRVVLHRVTPDTGFAVDSTASAADGAFRFSLPSTDDSSAVHVVSARHEGILYYGPVVHGGARPDSYVVAVYDTAVAESGASLTVSRRTLALMTDEATTRVLDVTEVTSRTGRTLVGPEAGKPWWRVSLPSGASEPGVLPGGIQPGETELGSEEVRISADVPPSGRRLTLGYRVPASGVLSLVVDHTVETLEVLHRGAGSLRPGPGLEATGPVGEEGGRYERFVGRGLAPGDTLRVELGAAPSGTGRTTAWWLLALSGALALGAWISWRRRVGAPSGPGDVSGGSST